jgi:hypothetical protein
VQKKSSKQPFIIVVEFENGATRNVRVKATSRENAEARALKFNPTATGVKRGK